MENKEQENKKTDIPNTTSNLNNDNNIQTTKRRKQGHKLTKAQRMQLMDKIWEAELAGFQPTQTIRNLNISRVTYYRLLNKKVEEINQTRLANSKQLLTKYFTRQEKAILKVLTHIDSIDDPKAKAEIELKRAQAITEAAKFVQSTGLMPKLTEQLSIDSNVRVDASSLISEFLQKTKGGKGDALREHRK